MSTDTFNSIWVHMKRISILVLTIIMTGCVSTESLRSVDRFQPYMGAKLLVKNSALCLVGNEALFERKIPNLQLQQSNWTDCYKGQVVTTLPEGTEIHVTDIIRTNLWALFYTEHWFAVGTVSVDDDHKDFYYYLGVFSCCKDEPPMEGLGFARSHSENEAYLKRLLEREVDPLH